MTSPQPGTDAVATRRHDDLVQRIGLSLLDSAPEDFRRIDVKVLATGGMVQLSTVVFMPDGSTAELMPERELVSAFTELRRVMYVPGRGAWFGARCVVDAPARIDISYNMDHDPKWFPPIDAGYFARDLEEFPRGTDHVRDWLRERLAEARHEEQPEPEPQPWRRLELPGQNAILGSVTTMLVQDLPGDWAQLFVDVRVAGSHVETRADVLTMYGGARKWELPLEALGMLLELREGMYRPKRGMWHSMRFRLTHPDTYSAEFNHDDEPDWISPPQPRHYAEELAAWPRQVDEMPAWWRERSRAE